jgi:hypothetical protein
MIWDEGHRFILAAETLGGARVAGPGTGDRPRPGSVSLQLHCTSLGSVGGRGPDGSPRAARRLIRDIGGLHLFERRSEGVLLLDPNADRGIVVAAKTFAAPGPAHAYLATRRGVWVMAGIDRRRLLPERGAGEPFTTQVPLDGSYLVVLPGFLDGPFLGFDHWQVDWVMSHYPSCYCGTLVLERRQIIDNGAARSEIEPMSDLDHRRGQCLVLGLTANGGAVLTAAAPTLDAARRTFETRPGRWLLTTVRHTINTR